jgi:SNF2 family DNA or RNA helicase
VVRFIARGTIEESVLALHAEKRELADALLAGGEAAARLTTRELLSLMERSAKGGDAEVDRAEPPEDDA